MANEKRLDLIDRTALLEELEKFVNPMPGEHGDGFLSGLATAMDVIEAAQRVDAVPVVHGYHPGDVCIYGFHNENKSLAIVEIVKILNDERGIAEVKFLKVFVDDTGNGMFNYLLRSGKTMNASFCYLKNITPIGAKMDGGNDDAV